MPFDCWYSKELNRNIQARHLSITVQSALPLSSDGIKQEWKGDLEPSTIEEKGVKERALHKIKGRLLEYTWC